jgi:hypothetical protein
MAIVVAGAALALGACGGYSPAGPTPGNGGGGTGGGGSTPPPNNLPVIDSITVQGIRSNEPANYADAGESVPVSAKVHDDETALDQLIYAWTATAGTFAGTGANVTWTAPPTALSPADVTISLTVTEKYGTGLAFEHSVAGTASLSLHDAVAEVGGMARQFLLDFSDSNIRDVPFIMRNFQPGCYGTEAETEQVSDNRQRFFITKFTVGQPNVMVNFGSVGPYGNQRGDAFAGVDVHWESNILAGGTDSVSGVDWVAAFYFSDQKRWRLCDSRFDGHKGFAGFIR